MAQMLGVWIVAPQQKTIDFPAQLPDKPASAATAQVPKVRKPGAAIAGSQF
jgi:hypothetical protein